MRGERKEGGRDRMIGGPVRDNTHSVKRVDKKTRYFPVVKKRQINHNFTHS